MFYSSCRVLKNIFVYYFNNGDYMNLKLEDNLINYLNEKMITNNYQLEKHTSFNDKKLKTRFVFNKIIDYVDDFLVQDTYHRMITLPGLRGVGKTTLLFQVYDYLIKKGVDKRRILYINVEDLMKIHGANILNACETFIKDINNAYPFLNEKLFILIDESQNDPQWAKSAKILYDEYFNLFAIYTGSNTLNMELTADTVRRNKKIPVYPLKFGEYLYLKNDISIPDIDEYINQVLLNNKIKDLKDIESNLYYDEFPKLNKNPKKIWEEYMKYGGFAYTLNMTSEDIIETTMSIVDKTIEKDMKLIFDMKKNTELSAKKMINLIASEKPGDLSENKISNILDVSSSQVKNILSIFEKTHLLFHIEAYGSAAKKSRKSWKYNFLSPTIKYAINKNYGNIQMKESEIMGLLSEDLVASRLFLNKYYKKTFNLYYESCKGGVDYLLKFNENNDNNIIPIEVGYGKKSLKHVHKSIERNNSPYGILISNRTPYLTREDNIICLPLILFSL